MASDRETLSRVLHDADVTEPYTDAEWAALVGPFRSDLLGDARAVLDLLGEAKAVLWDEGAEATAEWMANNPGPSGIPHDPPHNPYRKDT